MCRPALVARAVKRAGGTGSGFASDDSYDYFLNGGGVYRAKKDCCVATQP